MFIPALLAWTALQGATATDRPPASEIRAEGEATQSFIERGLRFYRQLHFQAARQEFEKAVAADPSNAAAHFYLGYTLYKIGEPTRRLTPEKQQAREEFARCFELDQSFRPVW